MTDQELTTTTGGPEIAVIGMAGRFPGAHDLDAFWANLRDGIESVSFSSDADLLAAGVDPALLSDPRYVRAGARIDEPERFDAAFFGFYPREAEVMDPQHRLFLECAWTALEHAGYDAQRYPGLIGVFGGAGMNTYLLFNVLPNPAAQENVQDYQITIANDKDFLPTRVSYKLNLRGPSVNVQTACSTSLVAVHMACQSLLSYQADMALAGGAALRAPQERGYAYREGGILAPDGHCRAFDANAGGTVPGNGVGVVVLKRLEDAIADGDTIHALIKATAINNDGANKVGYTAPGVDGQADVIATAQAIAGVDPESISYIEAHGTGTALGDPIEIAALNQVFAPANLPPGTVAIGSLKTNVGHMDAAAGVAGLIKTVLALKHRQLPPSLHFERPNPAINFEHTPFFVNATLRDWKTNRGPRRAGVSSIGIGGTNA
ncbi:MAG: polyketide synthase, partial [Oscillochloris sp.]|nr:polyketide synthase [Oscillochloris sp.]